jgi:DNA (cytosine-5)-methyltransferase 1
VNVGSLFTGIGGIDLGLERAGMRVAWQCENDPFCRRVLERHWPDVPCYSDVRTLHAPERVDVLAGGFPCQDLSTAGLRAGIDGERSGLWAEFARLIRELRPRFVLVENVPGLLPRGMGRVLGDLADVGYDADWDCIPAAALGAPHLRARIFILAYPSGGRRPGNDLRPGRHPIGSSREALADTNGARQSHAPGSSGQEAGRRPILGADDAERWAYRWPAEPAVGRVADGVPDGMDRLHALGNACVPQVVELIGRRMMEAS